MEFPGYFPCDPPTTPHSPGPRDRRQSDLRWNDKVGYVPQPFPKHRGIGVGHPFDLGDHSTLQGSVNVLITLLYQKHPSAEIEQQGAPVTGLRLQCEPY